MMKMNRMGVSGAFGLAAALLCLLAPADAAAQREMVIGGYGGSFERIMREAVLPSFEQANNVRIQYVAGQSTATLARLQAQRGNQELSVAIVDDGPMFQAIAHGFCAPIEAKEAIAQIWPIARLSDKAVAFAIGATGIVYNEKIFAERNLPVPQSWADLGNEAYRGQMSLLGLASTTGLHGLIMVARASGGGEANIDPGFAAFRTRIRPNLITFAPSAPKLEELLQNGEIAITVVVQARATALREAGLPIRFVTPKEGAGALMSGVCPVAGGKEPALAQALIAHLLSPAVQTTLAERGFGPANRTVSLPPGKTAGFPYGEQAIAKLAKIDWPVVNEHRAAWTQRWNREIER